jgi:hypothetical protein
MRLSLSTLLTFRGALIGLLKAIDTALLEGYGWTPRCRTAALDEMAYTEQ